MKLTGEWAKKTRLKAKMTQKELGEKLGIHLRYVRKMEKGEARVLVWFYYAMKGVHAEIAEKKKRYKNSVDKRP